MNGDAEYFRRRSVEEKSAAMKAGHPNAREAHLQMARRYDEFASALAASEGALLGAQSSLSA
jgi:hypothetical protein